MELECSNLDWVMWVATFSQVGDGDGDGKGEGRRRRRRATATAMGDGDGEGEGNKKKKEEEEMTMVKREGVGGRLVGGLFKWISNRSG